MSQEKRLVLLDTNLLVLVLLDPEILFPRMNERDKILSLYANEIYRRPDTTIIVPDLILDIEVPRVVLKQIVTECISDQRKLSMLLNAIKSLREDIESAEILGKYKLFKVWNSRRLRTAARLYNRIRIRISQKTEHDISKFLKTKHQDVLLLAVAKLENAIIVTADSDFKYFVKEGDIDVPVCYINVDKDARAVQISLLNVSDTDRAWFAEINEKVRQK